MTNQEQFQMFDFYVTEMDAVLANKTPRDINQMVVSMLSDIQEMIWIGTDKETIRRALNRAKYFADHADR